MDVPLGQREGERLEFKRAAALEQPHRIASEVVAMLNAEGGEIWIGISEENGRAVRIDSVEKPEFARRSLLDHLVDTIEPPPTGREIGIEVLKEGEATLLRLEVNPDPRRGPYCQLRSGLRRVFVKRIGDRIRPMSREEIFGAYRPSPQAPQDDLTRAAKKIGEERSVLQKEGKPLFWVRLQPVPGVELPVDKPSILDTYLTDYSASGNRPAGWNFVNSYLRPKPGKDKFFTEDPIGQRTEIRSDGGVAFLTPLQELARWDKEQEINPLSLLEFTSALFRLASVLSKNFPVEGNGWLLADAALIQIQGWRLRPGSPGSNAFLTRFDFQDGEVYEDAQDLVWEAPLHFKLADCIDHPDRCGFRLVRRVYQAFGYFEDAIPGEFDRATGRLVLD